MQTDLSLLSMRNLPLLLNPIDLARCPTCFECGLLDAYLITTMMLSNGTGNFHSREL